MTAELTASYGAARRQAKDLLLSVSNTANPGADAVPSSTLASGLSPAKEPGLAWKDLLPLPQDESWRKVDLSSIEWDKLSDRLATLIPPQTPNVEGPHTRPSSEQQDRMLNILTSVSELEDRLLQPEEPRRTPESFFRRDIFTLVNLAFSEPLLLVATPSSDASRLTIRHLPSDSISLPCTVLLVPKGVEASIVEEYPIEEASLRCGHTVIVVEEGARLRYTQMRDGGKSAHFHHVRFLVERNAYVEAGLLQSGGGSGKTFFQASIPGTGGEFHGKALFAGHDTEVFHLEMGVQHTGDHGVSSLLYKTVLNDRSHSVFLGNLEVPYGVKKVNSHQLNHNLILSQRARAESRPWLVIRAEDVSCEHGATVGDLDDEALFFLQSRGLPEEEARQLMIQGFFEEVLGEMPLSEEEKEAFRRRFF